MGQPVDQRPTLRNDLWRVPGDIPGIELLTQLLPHQEGHWLCKYGRNLRTQARSHPSRPGRMNEELPFEHLMDAHQTFCAKRA
jgi:hypothetical protein